MACCKERKSKRAVAGSKLAAIRGKLKKFSTSQCPLPMALNNANFCFEYTVHRHGKRISSERPDL
jgi:hypothetical protein